MSKELKAVKTKLLIFAVFMEELADNLKKKKEQTEHHVNTAD